MTFEPEILVIGGGPAGLSAALVLARARRRVLVIDDGQPRNAPARGVHGLLGQEGIDPRKLIERGRAEVLSYGGHVIAGRVVDAVPQNGGVEVALRDGQRLRARALLISTGVRDTLPEIRGLGERWGRDVIHCAYCHGWEIGDRRIGILGTTQTSPIQALMLTQWSRSIAYFAHGNELSPTDNHRLASIGVTVHPPEVSSLSIVDDQLVGVVLNNGAVEKIDTLVVTPSSQSRLEGLERLDLPPSPGDADGRTSVEGVWAAGNVTHPGHQVSEAIAHGARVAMNINAELTVRSANRMTSMKG